MKDGKCKAANRTVRQTLNFKATSQLLSPMKRAVALVQAIEETFLSLANASASVVSMASKSSKVTGFLTVRRLGDCKKAMVVSQGGEPPLGYAHFFLDGRRITSQTSIVVSELSRLIQTHSKLLK
jgi:hypothetical protein